MPLSWNEIRHRAIAFSKEWRGETREAAERQSFWNEFFNVFGIRRRTVTETTRRGNWTQLNWQLAQAKALLREMRETVADIEDARTIERAKRANGNKPRIAWADVKRDLHLG